MSCITVEGDGIKAIICGFADLRGRLHLGNRYVFVEHHHYCGPSFYWDQAGMKPYEPADENDPIWPLYQAWYEKAKGNPDR